MMLSEEIKTFVREHETNDVNTLALQAKRYPMIDMYFVINQIKGRQIAKLKIPSWYTNENICYPKHLSLEQCSSEATAMYKVSLCNGKTMADLTGGFGVDFSFLAQKFKHAVYVEQQEELVKIAAHNCDMLGLRHAETIHQDGVAYLKTMERVDLIYLDPARRDAVGRKTVSISDCTPDILEIEDLLLEKAKRVIIKLSPMLDISLALKSLRFVSDIYIVSSNNECKELLFVEQQEKKETTLHCVNLTRDGQELFSFTKQAEETATVSHADTLHTYLYEPNVSVLKGGAYKSIAECFSVKKLHVDSHLYTSEQLIDDFPGRKFRVECVCSLNKHDLKKHIAPLIQANIAIRNFPSTVDELRKKTKLKDGGDTYIFATTLKDGQRVLVVCKKA